MIFKKREAFYPFPPSREMINRSEFKWNIWGYQRDVKVDLISSKTLRFVDWYIIRSILRKRLPLSSLLSSIF